MTRHRLLYRYHFEAAAPLEEVELTLALALVSVECLGGLPIPQFRLVYFQVDREERNRPELPEVLRKASVLSAVFRVGECVQSTGAPGDYALRLLVEPTAAAAGGSATQAGTMTA